MSNESPASILYSETGQPIGVMYDGIFYRLQTDAKITDGYNIAAVKPASTAADATDPALVVAISPNNSVEITQPSVSSTVNSTTTPLTANSTFTGTFEDVSTYATISITLYSDQSSAANGFIFQWSGDGVNADRNETSGFTAGSNGRALTFSVRGKYFRLIYTNGTVNQSVFRLYTNFHSTGSGLITKPLSSDINDYNVVQQTEAILAARRLDGAYGHVGVDNFNRLLVSYADSPEVDAFSRLRISSPYTLFDNKMLYDASPNFWDDQQISGSGTTSTFMTNQSYLLLTVSNLTTGTRVRQTFRRFNYQPGKSHLIFLTGILGIGATGITRRLGYFDGSDGVFFELAGTTLNLVVRTSTSGTPTDTRVPQSSWNLDKLDGTGVSGYTLDTSKAQIFMIDFQWLGTGRIRFGFDFTGAPVYCHQILNANANSLVYMKSPNLPLRYEISNDGTGVAASLGQICGSVMSEGGVEDTGFILSIDRGSNGFTTLSNTDLFPLIAIRLKSTAQNATIAFSQLTIICSSNAAYRYALIINPIVVGTAFSYSSVTGSALEADVSTTNATTITGGTLIVSGYGQAGGSTGSTLDTFPSNLEIGSSINGTSDVLVLAVTRLSGTQETFYGSLTWREEI